MNNLNSQQNYHKVDEEQHRQKRGNLLVTAPKGQSVNIPVCENFKIGEAYHSWIENRKDNNGHMHWESNLQSFHPAVHKQAQSFFVVNLH
jgi:hypothetical protein